MKKKHKSMVVLALVLVGLALSFHYKPDTLEVFPKANLTFKNTIIYQEDIDRIIERYNNNSVFGQIGMRQEPFVQTLLDRGLVKRDLENN